MRSFLLWCTVINYATLLVWFQVFMLAHGWMRFHPVVNIERCQLFIAAADETFSVTMRVLLDLLAVVENGYGR